VYTVNMDTFILLWPSIVSGVLIGWVVKRPWLFIMLIFIASIVIAGTIYLADLIHMRNIGQGYSESWAGLVIPFLSVGCFVFLAPTAIGVAGLKWIISRQRKK
jgi:hypothetical protein